MQEGSRVPRRKGAFILVGGEWMEVQSVNGDRINVRRGERGTLRQGHAAGELVHFGQTVTSEVPIPLYADDWNLSAR